MRCLTSSSLTASEAEVKHLPCIEHSVVAAGGEGKGKRFGGMLSIPADLV